jgi:hypothetical protein
MSEKKRWLLVVVFATAMAWMESATVTYLRTLVDRIEPYQPAPLPISSGLGEAELVRETATLIMLFAAGWLAGKTWRTRLGYALIAFGAWDILYYVFLKIITGWPNSIWDWDILFLLPLPWWGPVLAPVIIAAIMICFGTLVTQFNQTDLKRPLTGQPIWPRRWVWLLNLSGVALALFVFMADAIGALSGGTETIQATLPHRFNWPLFSLAVVLIAVPVVDMFIHIWRGRRIHQSVVGASGKMHFTAQSLLLILIYKTISSET